MCVICLMFDLESRVGGVFWIMFVICMCKVNGCFLYLYTVDSFKRELVGENVCF